jgi:hypothetical protein
LPKGKKIHTFANPNGLLVGADWTRQQTLAALKASPFINRTQGTARAMKHGMCILHNGGPLFIATEE